jgi:hypothetical protein
VIESTFVSTSAPPPSSPQGGVLRALASGFDRVAARPYLILPALVLDLFLWLGPRLQLKELFDLLAATLRTPAGTSAELANQISLVQESLITLGERFNLFSTLATFPIGLPSLMASTLPAESPLGEPAVVAMTDPAAIAGIWLSLTILGLGVAALYHGAVSSAAAPDAPSTAGWIVWLRVLVMAGLAYLALAGVGFTSLLAASIVSLIVPFLGPGVAFLGFTLLFWVAVYLAFTPHGLVRYGLGLVRAMRESVELVRRNLMATVGLLALLLAISWIGGYVWELPPSESWLTSLAIVGHAFVSAMLLAASYIFYVGRREAMLAVIQPTTSADKVSADRRNASGT